MLYSFTSGNVGIALVANSARFLTTNREVSFNSDNVGQTMFYHR